MKTTTGHLEDAPAIKGSAYPAPHHLPCVDRERSPLGDGVGITKFGVNRMVLQPGCWSSQRHWHSHEDEFVLVLEGEVSLLTAD